MKSERIKDSKNKEKIDLSRSIQNLTYLVPSSNTEVVTGLNSIAKENDI